MELVDIATWVERIGIPGAIAISLVILAFRGIQAFREDRKSRADDDKRETDREAAAQKRADDLQNRLLQFLQTSIEQNTLLRDALEKQNDKFVKAVEGQTIQLTAMQAAFLQGLSDTFSRAQDDRKQITADIASTLGGVETRLATHVDDGLRLVQVSTDALAAGIEVQHQDNRAALDALHTATAENANTAGELRRLAELVESAKNVQDERAQAVVAEIMKAITPRLDQIAETLRVVLERLTPPPTLPEPLPAADAPRVTVTEAT